MLLQIQEYQDLYNSSVAIMLREMQREVDAGRPLERRLHIDYSTNNLHAANDIDCCFMAFVSWGKPAGPRIMGNLWSNLMLGPSMNLREQIAELFEQTADKKGKTQKTSRVSEELKSS